MPPPAVTAEQIEEYAPRMPARTLKVDANVAAYFGDLFHALRVGLSKAPRKGPIEAAGGAAPRSGALGPLRSPPPLG